MTWHYCSYFRCTKTDVQSLPLIVGFFAFELSVCSEHKKEAEKLITEIQYKMSVKKR